MEFDIEGLKRAAGVRPYERRLGALKREGRGFVATCPWHDDRHPSLHIFEKDGIWLWKCFTCGEKAGDVFSFVQKLDGVNFAEAVKRVREDAVAAGEDRENVREDHGVKTYAIVPDPSGPAFAFDRAAAAAEIERAGDYLAGRGIPLELARQVGLGYVPGYPGVGEMIALPYSDQPDAAVKLRALAPKDKTGKFRHIKGQSSADSLYGIGQLDTDGFVCSAGDVWVVESELDSLTMRAHGFTAVSVSSATTSVAGGRLKIKPEHLQLLHRAERIFVAADMDDAGQKCAAAFAAEFPAYKLFRVTWPFHGKDAGDPKDVGELYAKFRGANEVISDAFTGFFQQLRQQALDRPPEWRRLFKSRSEMEGGPIRFLIEKFLPEGVCIIAALSASGKTWLALSIAKALTTGRKFLGIFKVPAPVDVLYLVPEAGERAFRNRLEKMGLSDRFLCRTMKDGVLDLDDPLLLAAMRDLKPVVILDTAIRFSNVESENSASENAQGLANAIFGLITAGAQAVIGLHHSPKDAAKQEHLTLETALRGTGDIGAMCDAVYALRCVNQETLEIQVQCVKPRDFEPVGPFHIVGRPFINEIGDFVMLAEPDQPRESAEVEKLVEAINADPHVSYEALSKLTGVASGRIARVAAKAGWKKERGRSWASATGEPLLDLQAA